MSGLIVGARGGYAPGMSDYQDASSEFVSDPRSSESKAMGYLLVCCVDSLFIYAFHLSNHIKATNFRKQGGHELYPIVIWIDHFNH